MLKRTPLYEEEVRLGAEFTEFAEWEMPLSYSGIVDEHMAVRSSAGLFDVSHLGKISLGGARAAEALQRLATIDVGKIPTGRGAYTVFCTEDGGIIDDDIVYRFKDEEYWVITNAARRDALLDWFNGHTGLGVSIKDRTAEFCLLALQGPDSPDLLKSVLKEDPGAYKRYSVRAVTVEGSELLVMRSGYTGEEGYELLGQPEHALRAWRMLLNEGVTPAGLGARDTLRLEMGYPLYGRDLTTETTPLEADLGWLVSFEKGDFTGREALLKQQEEGAPNKLVGFILDKGIARGGEPVRIIDGKTIGIVTSGGYSPVLRRGIGLGYVKREYAQPGLEIKIEVRNKQLTGRIERRPFIKR